MFGTMRGGGALIAKSSVSAEAFRDALSRYASGVTVVTALVDGRKWGFTATAFASVSADPPLVMVCLARTSRGFDAFSRAERYAIHILATEHASLAGRFASALDDKFHGLEHSTTETGEPVIPAYLTLLHCTAEQTVDAGDHVILIGRVHDIQFGDGEPLLYCNREFARLGGTVPAQRVSCPA